MRTSPIVLARHYRWAAGGFKENGKARGTGSVARRGLISVSQPNPPAVASARKPYAWSEPDALFLPSPAVDDLGFDSFDPPLSELDDFSALACLLYSLER